MIFVRLECSACDARFPMELPMERIAIRSLRIEAEKQGWVQKGSKDYCPTCSAGMKKRGIPANTESESE